MTPRREDGVFTPRASSSWGVFVIVAVIAAATVQVIGVVKSITKTDEVLKAITEVQTQMGAVSQKDREQDAAIIDLQHDSVKLRERVAGIEGSGKMAVPAVSRGRD